MAKPQIESSSSCVYLLHCVGTAYYKIGHTEGTASRLAGMSSDCPFQLALVYVVSGTETIEEKLHDAYAENEIVNKWFCFKRSEIPIVIAKMKQLSTWFAKIPR